MLLDGLHEHIFTGCEDICFNLLLTVTDDSKVIFSKFVITV